MSRSPAADWVENRPPAGWWPRLDPREIVAFREVALALALKDLKVRYKQTVFGAAWALFQPLLAALIFTIVFGRIARLPTGGVPYPVFVYAGLTIWLYFASSLQAAAASLVDNRDLVTKIYFPRLLAPLAAVVPGLVDLAVSISILGVFLAVYGIVPGVPLLLLPAWVLAALFVALSTGLWLSALNVKYRDVRHVLGFLLQLWLFASPVVYTASLVDGAWRYVFFANPMAAVIEGFRWSLDLGPAPGGPALVSLSVTLVLLATGAVYFHKVERFFADTI